MRPFAACACESEHGNTSPFEKGDDGIDGSVEFEGWLPIYLLRRRDSAEPARAGAEAAGFFARPEMCTRTPWLRCEKRNGAGSEMNGAASSRPRPARAPSSSTLRLVSECVVMVNDAESWHSDANTATTPLEQNASLTNRHSF